MEAIKLTVLEKQRKEQEAREQAMRTARRQHTVACYCACDCFIKEGQRPMAMGASASWNID